FHAFAPCAHGATGCMRAHGTVGTHSSGSLVFERASNRMDSAWLKDLPGWTAIDVLHRIKGKGFISEDPFFASRVSCVAGRFSHVRRDPARLARYGVFIGAILVIGHYGLHSAARVLLMLIDQLHELLVFRD